MNDHYSNEDNQLDALGRHMADKRRKLSERETDDAIEVIIVHRDRVVSESVFTTGEGNYRVLIVNIDGND